MSLLSLLKLANGVARIRRRLGAAWRALVAPSVPVETVPSPPEPEAEEEEPEPRPPMVYFQDGVGYTEAPDYLEAWSPDKGQHDLIKMDMRLAMWRYQNGHHGAGVVDVHAAGASYRPESRYVGALFPVTPDLAEGSRRLGYSRLVAATGLRVSAESEAEFWSTNEETAKAFAAVNYAANAKTAASWPAHMGRFAHDSEAEVLRAYTLGEPDGPTLPPGKVAAPLTVFAFTRTRTPDFVAASPTQGAPSGPGSR